MKPSAPKLKRQERSQAQFSHERDSFDDTLDDIADLHRELKLLNQRLRAYVLKEHDRILAQRKLAAAFIDLGKQVDDAVAASFLVETHQLLASGSNIAAGCLEADIANLVEPMEEQTRMNEAIFLAFSKRREEKLAFLADFDELLEQRRLLKDDYDAYFATSGGTLVDFMRLTSAHEDLDKLTQKNVQRKDALMKDSELLLAEYRLTKNALWLETLQAFQDYFSRKVSCCEYRASLVSCQYVG